MEAVKAPGRVVTVYPEKRDRVLLRFPCFQTDAKFDRGMSGGPVFDQAGALCGIVSVGMERANCEECDAEEVSHAALLWPSLATRLTAPPFEGQRVYDLARKGILQVEGLDRVGFPDDDVIGFDPRGIEY